MSARLDLMDTTCRSCHVNAHAGLVVKTLIVTTTERVYAVCRCRLCDAVETYSLRDIGIEVIL